MELKLVHASLAHTVQYKHGNKDYKRDFHTWMRFATKAPIATRSAIPAGASSIPGVQIMKIAPIRSPRVNRIDAISKSVLRDIGYRDDLLYISLMFL